MSETSLQEMLQRAVLPPKPTRLLILQQVAEELDTAHRRDKLHGHLTPKSIVVTEGTPRGLIAAVTDFGAKFVLDQEILGDRLPEDVHYISPEQILGLDLGEQADLFSFGVIAYELVCGRKPFEAEGISPLFYKICTEPAEAVQQIDPTLSEEVNEVFERALAKKPERRYGVAREFVQALTTALGHCEGWRDTGRRAEPPPAFAAAAPASPPPKPSPSFEQQRAPTRAAYELPTLQRRRRFRDEYDDEEVAGGGSRTKKLALAAAICVFLGGAGVFLTRWVRTPNLPVQVLDTKGGPSTPPPQSNPVARTPADSPSTQPEKSPATSPTSEPQAEKPPEAAADTAPPPASTPAPQPSNPAPTDVTREAAPSKPDRTAANPDRVASRPTATRDTAVPRGTASVEFLTIPPGGRTVVDNNPLMTCTAPCSMPLENGRHTLRAQLQGYSVAQRVFNVPDENTQTIALAKQTGALVVTSVPTAVTILVDGTDFGLTPSTLHLTPGQHRLTLLNGSQRHEEVVTVVGDAIQAANITFPQ